MKSKDIRKEHVKKKATQPKSTSDVINISVDGFNYCILYDNYKATVYRTDVDGAIAVYRAAERSWKILPGLMSHSIKPEVEKLYSWLDDIPTPSLRKPRQSNCRGIFVVW